MAKAYLSLGSNLGDRLGLLRQALRLLDKAAVKVKKVSSVYQSAPVDYEDQPDFLNVVAEVSTKLEPEELLAQTRRIEEELGRERTALKGPRTIDIDIVLYDRLRVVQPDLVIPHPRMAERIFVLIPLLEIAPRVKFPSGKQVGQSVKVSALSSNKIQKMGSLQ